MQNLCKQSFLAQFSRSQWVKSAVLHLFPPQAYFSSVVDETPKIIKNTYKPFDLPISKPKSSKQRVKNTASSNLSKKKNSTKVDITQFPSIYKHELYAIICLELMTDTEKGIQFLKQFSPILMEQFIQIFHQNLFQIDHSQIATMFSNLIKSEVLSPDKRAKQKTIQTKKSACEELGKKIMHSFEIIAEFMEKGLVGLLSGDISLVTLDKIAEEINIMSTNSVEFLKEIEKILPSLVQNEVILKSDFYEINYFLKQLIESFVTTAPSKLPEFDSSSLIKELTQYLDKNEPISKIEAFSNCIEEYLNMQVDQMYHNISIYSFHLTQYLIPVHGIRCPEKENQVNMFYRQLILEQMSDHLAKFQKYSAIKDLVRINKAEELHSLKINFLNKWKEIMKDILMEEFTHFFIMKDDSVLKEMTKVPLENIGLISAATVIRKLCHHIVSYSYEYLLNYSQKMETHTLDYEELCMILGNNIMKEIHYYLKKTQNKGLESKEILKRSQSGKKKIGSYILQLISMHIKYEASPIFQIQNIQKEQQEDQKQYIIEINSSFLSHFINIFISTEHEFIHMERGLPMIFPPMNWKNIFNGGYYLRKSKLVKQESMNFFYIEKSDLKQFCEAVDSVSVVKWRINKRVLDVIEYIWSIGGGTSHIPERFNSERITEDELQNKKGRNLFFKMKEQAENHSLRCSFLLILEIARGFKNVKSIYFPHNVDFRGRAYPLSPHLNHMGSDLSRGILEFSEGKKLGKNGLYWLKINLANALGADKLSLQKRVEYIDGMIDKIHKWAFNPKANLEWLKIAEDPFQALSAIFEISDALQTRNPEEFISHMHVHVDGSFNGLQHYSAIGRDPVGAANVNLINQEKPADIYISVLNLIKKKLQEEKDPNHLEMAEILLKNIERKTIKQTVMTTVYGVTFIGGKAQIARKLKDMEYFKENPHKINSAALYLVRLTFQSLGDIFQFSTQFKEFLNQFARKNSSQDEKVKWITPLGLPCVQPYKNPTDTEIINTGSSTFQTFMMAEVGINKRKQGSAFPPNYIHSLDASHMLFTALKCKEKNISFAAVHDSYWAHACEIDELNNILREEFIKLHSQQLLEKLLGDSVLRLPYDKKLKNGEAIDFPKIPKKGDFDLDKIKEATYFFA